MQRSSVAPMNETSWPTELLVVLSREDRRPLRVQIEEKLREAIRRGTLRPGAQVPSTRDLARQLGVSRGVVVNAYSQLGAEGYLALRQGSRPRVSEAAARPAQAETPAIPEIVRFDFRLGVPDVSRFPRDVWIRCIRSGLSRMSTMDLGYGDERGVEALRSALADYLGRVRGVVATPERVVVTSGYLQGLSLVCRALAAAGVTRIAFENPSDTQPRIVAARAGLEIVPVGVDESGLQVEELEQKDVGAVVVTPAHQFPTGALMAAGRRAALAEWLRRRDAFAIEDDYDAEYRYDRSPVGALQGLNPERIIYAGSTSKTLAPALRIGWLVVPGELLDSVAREKLLADRGTARIEQFALADFIAKGELDRHLRRMRIRYRRRRDALVQALAETVPESSVGGIAAGLHVAIQLPDDDDEEAIVEEIRRRRVAVSSIGEFCIGVRKGPPTLLLGYAQASEGTIRSGLTEIAAAIEASRHPGLERWQEAAHVW
jgi:GntR family transcriptional regulator/MocR family aminotransferase